MPVFLAKEDGDWTAVGSWNETASSAGAAQTAYGSSGNSATSYSTAVAFTLTNALVIDGVLIVLKRLSTTGTFTVGLSDDNGATWTKEVTVNCSDIPANQTAMFFKFGSSLTADGGSDYKVSFKSSTANTVTVYRSGTANEWFRILRLTSSPAALAAADSFYVAGAWTAAATVTAVTITMDNVDSTDWGTVASCNNGTISYGYSASTNYQLKMSGDLIIWAEGTFSIGTSGNPIPSTSTAQLLLDSASVGQYTIWLFGTFNAYGATRTYTYCRLAADVSVNGTSLTTDVSTGWLSDDLVALPATSVTPSESERGDLNGAASGTTLTVHGFGGVGGGVAYAHAGTSLTRRGHVLLLTRNVKIQGVSTTNTAILTTSPSTGAAINCSYAEFFNFGKFNGGVSLGIYLYPAVMNIQKCAFYDIHDAANQYLSGMNVHVPSGGTFSYNTTFLNSFANGQLYVSVAASGVVSYNVFSHTRSAILNGIAGTYTFNVFAAMREPAALAGNGWALTAVIEDNEFYCSSSAFNFSWTETTMYGVVFTRLNFWRTVLNTFGLKDATFNACKFQVVYTASKTYENVIFNDCVWEADAGVYRAARGFYLQTTCTFNRVTFNSCTFGVVETYSSADVAIDITCFGFGWFDNCLLGSSVPVQTGTGSGPTSFDFWSLQYWRDMFLRFSKWQQTAGSHRTYFKNGLIQTDAVIYDVSGVSERMYSKNQTDTTINIESTGFRKKIASGATATFTVRVRKSAAGDAGGADYVGSEPRLLVRVNRASGLVHSTPLVLDTMTAAVGNWETLTGTTAAVSDDAVLEAYIETDGSTGWVNVQNWS